MIHDLDAFFQYLTSKDIRMMLQKSYTVTAGAERTRSCFCPIKTK